MNSIPRVSVVIPSYNAQDYILEAIGSVRNQRVESIEIIVVDDGSTDDSLQLLEEQAPDVRVISQKNGGPASARNRGIAESQGEFIAFLDADDVWLPGKLAAQIRELEENPDVSVCYGGFQSWLGDERHQSLASQEAEASNQNLKSIKDFLLPVALLFDSVVWTPTALVRSASVKNALYFDEALDVGEDYDLWFRLALEHQFLYLPKTVALYRDNAASITKKVPRCNFEKLVVERNIEKLQHRFHRGLMQYLRPSIEKRLADLDYNYGRACFMAYRREDAHRAIASFLTFATTPSALAMWLCSTYPWSFRLGHWLLCSFSRFRQRS